MIRLLLLTILMLGPLVLIGCSPPDVAIFNSNADPSHQFNAPHELRVSVLAMREDKIDLELEPTLPEKVLTDDVEIGLSQAGFQVVPLDGELRPDLIFFCDAETIEEVVDSYERIPTTDTVMSTNHTRRGFRTSYGVIHSSVVVPTRRWYTFTRVHLAAVESRLAFDAESKGTQVDLSSVWESFIEASGPLVMRQRVWQVREALNHWGQTGGKRMEFPKK
ncbi:MAG: hypothetical protein O7G85_11195 [Planctomycetota bacterium]|nr:hypothetical protein [Planctomycetota bacterium]